MNQVIVASYNMSFLSDMTAPIDEMQFASEAAFLTNNRSHDRRLYWKNALELLVNFIGSYGVNVPVVIGLQEMNLSYDENSGTGAVVSAIESKYPGIYSFVAKEIINGGAKPALMIIYNKDFFGDVMVSEIIDNENDKGRPILIVYTKKGYLFFNCHGGQKGPAANKEFIEKTLNKFVSDNGKVTDVFGMGDFNDRYDGITEIFIDGKRTYYKGDSPYSCCYNWNSSCSAQFNTQKMDPQGHTQCNNETVAKTIMTNKGQIKLPMPYPEGSVENYRFKGDKVFSTNPEEEIKMYHGKNGKGQSVESDHELVYALCNAVVIPMVGGRRTRKNIRKSIRKSTRKYVRKTKSKKTTGGRKKAKSRTSRRK